MKSTIIAAAAATLTLTAFLAVPAQATLLRTFVGPTGNDANPCSLSQPCRTLQVALAQTTAGGEIAILGTAGYNNQQTLNIDRAISIVNPGAFEAGLFTPAGGTAITINAGAGDAVSLRGLTIEGGGIGVAGIQFITGASLTVQNCIIRHMTGSSAGLLFTPSGASNLFVSRTVVSDNAYIGIAVQPTGANAVTAVLNRVEANGNKFGIVVDGQSASGGTIKATAFNTTASGNSSDGIEAASSSGTTTLMLNHVVVANNGSGVVSFGANTTTKIYQSVLNGNATGWSAFGGVIQSYVNNSIDGNTAGNSAPTVVNLH